MIFTHCPFDGSAIKYKGMLDLLRPMCFYSRCVNYNKCGYSIRFTNQHTTVFFKTNKYRITTWFFTNEPEPKTEIGMSNIKKEFKLFGPKPWEHRFQAYGYIDWKIPNVRELNKQIKILLTFQS